MRTKRCRQCDLDGEVPLVNPKPGQRPYIPCPVCDGTKKFEVEDWVMNEEDLYRWLVIGCASLAALAGLGAIGVLILCAANFALGTLVAAIGLAGGCVAASYFAVTFGSKAEAPRVFNNQDEKEVLNSKQRKALKAARGEVVFERAMTEVEYERDNIVHRAIEAATDPDRPPHDTRWSHVTKNVRELRGKEGRE